MSQTTEVESLIRPRHLTQRASGRPLGKRSTGGNCQFGDVRVGTGRCTPIRKDRLWLETAFDDAQIPDDPERAKSDRQDAQRLLHEAAKLRTHEFRRGDRRVRTHDLILKWLDVNLPESEKGIHAKYEILLLVEQAQRHGFFSFSTKRVREVCGKRTDDFIRKFVRECSFVKKIANYRTGVRSNRYRLAMPTSSVVVNTPILDENNAGDVGILTDESELPTDDRRRGQSWVWSPTAPVFVVVPREWLLARCVRWHVVANVNGWFASCDYFGTNFGGVVQETLASISVDVDFNESCPSGCSIAEWEGGKRERHRAWHAKLLSRSLIRSVRCVFGRLYYSLTSCPKSVRRSLRMAGERIGEVDVSGSYLCALTSQLWEDTASRRQRKRMLIEWLRTGEIYERIAKAAGFTWTDRVELKKQFQIQCLFWKGHMPLSARPLWRGLRELFPDLARFILGVRREAGGSTGLSDYLMWRESQVMFPIFERVGREGIPFLPNHDGILVPESYVDRVHEIAESIAGEVLGFTPMVKVKRA